MKPDKHDLVVGRSLAAGSSASLTFCAPNRTILIIEEDGRLVRGPDFRTDDVASVEFFDSLARHLPGYLSDLRQRAETAEAELAALKTKSGLRAMIGWLFGR